jgi:FkbM family methyltransferase
MSRFVEALKYFSVLFQMRTNYLKYILAVFLYRLKRKVEFPKAIVRLNGAKFITRENSMDIAHLSNFYERETTNLLLDLNPETFVDVGTHIGRFSLILANKGSRVVSIEPSKDNFRALNKNIKLNNLQDKIKAINIGCSDKNGKTVLYFVPQNEGLTSLEKRGGARKEIINVKTLDSLCKSLNVSINANDVIKVDVEGFELNVLKGASNILKKGKSLLIIEITDKAREKSIKDYLSKFGYVNTKVLDLRNFIFVKD